MSDRIAIFKEPMGWGELWIERFPDDVYALAGNGQIFYLTPAIAEKMACILTEVAALCREPVASGGGDEPC